MSQKVNLPPLDIPAQAVPIVTPPQPKFNPIIIVIVLVVLFSIIATFVYAFSLGKKTAVPVIPIATPTSLISPAPTINSTPTVSANSGEFGTLAYLSSPEKITNPTNILSPTSPDTGGNYIADRGTYKVGNFSSGAELLIMPILPEGPSSPYNYRLIRQNDKYFLVESLINDAYIKTNLSKVFRSDIVKPISYSLTDLLPPIYLSVDNRSFNQLSNGFGASQFVTELKDKTKISTIEYGDLFSSKDNIKDLSDVSQRVIYLQLHDFTLIPYRLDTNLYFSDDRVPRFTFSDNSPNATQYDSAIKTGCGGAQLQTIIKDGSSLLANKTVIGRTNGGANDVYQIKDANSQLVKFLYNQYSSTLGSGGPTPLVSNIGQFTETPNHILFQDKLGDWEVYVNTKYAMQAECGKPVIYLYPTTDTQVSVKVGAAITKSDPTYPQTGWNVLAHPSGQLEYQSKIYPNLFWEGTGFGPYNSHFGEGFVVPQDKLISTINSHLVKLGLNAQESADFMEFWQPKLPNTPFVRLTWLGTADMNQLAPLQVSPQPKTTIRLFLDFAGLDTPIKLTPQKLSAPIRRGLTLVEWGGLLVK